MLKNIIKKNKWYAKMKRIVKLPQVQLFTILLMLAVIMIIISSCMTNSFWSSFFSNISAGLFTGCLTDGQWGSVPFNQEVYDRIKEEMIDPEDDGKRDYIVNMQWAGECIHNMAEKLNE